MNKNLIGISGKKRSGKNCTASIINKLLSEEELNFCIDNNLPINAPIYEEKSFAYLVKKFASELTGIPLSGWETEEDKARLLGHEWDYLDETGNMVGMTRRKMLQKLGSDACNQNLHRDCWINGLFQNYTAASQWLITDVRFPQEVSAIKKRDGIVIRVIRKTTETRDAHISETALDDYNEFDFVIMNDGDLRDLEIKVRDILVFMGLLEKI